MLILLAFLFPSILSANQAPTDWFLETKAAMIERTANGDRERRTETRLALKEGEWQALGGSVTTDRTSMIDGSNASERFHASVLMVRATTVPAQAGMVRLEYLIFDSINEVSPVSSATITVPLEQWALFEKTEGTRSVSIAGRVLPFLEETR